MLSQKVVDIYQNGTIIEDVSDTSKIQINTEVVPSSSDLNSFVLSNGEYNFSPSQENVEYFKNIRFNVSVPPSGNDVQIFRDYEIDSLNVQSDSYIYPEPPYNSMAVVKVTNNFLNKVEDRTVITTHNFSFTDSYYPSNGFEATRQVTVIRLPIISTFYGVGYSDRDQQRTSVNIPFSELTIADSDKTVPAIEGYGILIAYKLKVDPKYEFGYEYLYCIEFKRVEYYIASYTVKKGCAYIRFRDAQRWQCDVYYFIKSSSNTNLATFRFPWVDHAGSAPRDKWPSLADTTACVSFPSSYFSMPLFDDDPQFFTEDESPYIINYVSNN